MSFTLKNCYDSTSLKNRLFLTSSFEHEFLIVKVVETEVKEYFFIFCFPLLWWQFKSKYPLLLDQEYNLEKALMFNYFHLFSSVYDILWNLYSGINFIFKNYILKVILINQ